MHIFKVLHFWHLLNNKFQNACKNPWFLRSKIEKNRYKTLKKSKLFLTSIFHRFFLDFGLVLGGSWRGLGDHLAVQDGTQKGKINIFNKIEIFQGFGEGLGRVLGRFGDGFGRVLVRSGSLLGIPLWMHPCWALLGFAGLCLAWFGFAWPGLALLGCAGLCWALLVFAGLCWALLGFAWLS